MKSHMPFEVRKKVVVGDLVESSRLPGTGRATVRAIRNTGKPQRQVYEVRGFGVTALLERGEFKRVYYTAADDGSCECVEP
jgi:hypothetical protein